MVGRMAVRGWLLPLGPEVVAVPDLGTRVGVLVRHDLPGHRVAGVYTPGERVLPVALAGIPASPGDLVFVLGYLVVGVQLPRPQGYCKCLTTPGCTATPARIMGHGQGQQQDGNTNDPIQSAR